MSSKSERLQIRVSAEEHEGIRRRAQAAGMSVADYGRRLLLSGDVEPLLTQESMLDSVGEAVVADDPIVEDETDVMFCSVKDVPPGVRCFVCGEVHQ